MDTAQFTSQLVSFSQVEQQLKSNADLDKLVKMAGNNQTQLGLSYIGLDVVAQGSQFSFDPAKESSVTLGYSLASAAAKDNISVLDSKGNTVFSTTGSLAQGANTFTWNGKDSNGNPAPAGNYTIQVSASDATNSPVSATTQVPGQVTGMQTASDGTVQLVVGGQVIPLSSITSASLPQTASAK
jgi:flagellar basal-body rod modification protein FlgD